MKSIKNLLLIFAVLFACNVVNAKQPMRLLYWNIQNGMWDGQTDNYQRFTNWVNQQKPDICVWCEAQKLYKVGTDSRERETEEECLARWKELAMRYGHPYVYLSAHPDNYPQLITSKYPVEMIDRMSGNQDTIVAHGASWSKVKIGKQVINIVTLHTWPQRYGYGIPKTDEARQASGERHEGDKFRATEMEYICQHSILKNKKADKELWMMMGDFNAISRLDNHHYQYAEDDTRFLTHNYILDHTPYIDAVKQKHPGEFISSTGSGNRIDFVYMTAPLFKQVKDINIIKDSYTKPVRNPQNISNFWHPSDHCPIICDFVLK